MSKVKHSVENLAKRYESDISQEDLIKKTLLKKAKGFIVEEISEEYSREEGEKGLKLLKRKVTSKEVPPDINAIKVLIELNQFDLSNYKNMTDEELICEKNRLIKLLEGDKVEEIS